LRSYDNFIFTKCKDKSVAKFTNGERLAVKSIVANLSIKRLPDNEIIKAIYEQTNKMITRMELWNIRKRIKKESYHWYKTMREGEYEYIHEFKERIDEILWLQRKHHEIIDSPSESTMVKQSSLQELHRLNITLSNYFDVAPSILGNGSTLSAASEINKIETTNNKHIIV
jgi:hypothetical protein